MPSIPRFFPLLAGAFLMSGLPAGSAAATPKPKAAKGKPAADASPATTPKPAATPKQVPAADAPAPDGAAAAADSGNTVPPASPRFKTGLGLADIPADSHDAPSREAQRLNRLASDEFNRGDLANARTHFESALKIAPGNPSVLINLGLLAYRLRDYAQAEVHLRRVLRAQPESGLAWLILGVVYHDQDKLDAALAALAQAAFYEPKDARVHHYLGVTVGKKGWYLGAEDEMRKAIELQPDYAEAHFNLAVFYLQRTPPAVELARRHYLKARSLGAEPDFQLEKSLEH